MRVDSFEVRPTSRAEHGYDIYKVVGGEEYFLFRVDGDAEREELSEALQNPQDKWRTDGE